MVIDRPIYFVVKAWQSLRHTPGLSLLTAGTISAALCVVGLYIMSVQNLESLALVWGRAGNISCYLADDVPSSAYEHLTRELAALTQVERVEVITPKQALQRFVARGPEAAALVQGVDDDILPAAVELYVRDGFTDLQVVRQVATQAQAVSGVAAVDFGETEFVALSALVRLLRYGAWIFGAFVAIATALIVANTIRLMVYAQRDEIAILRLVGATHSFIRTPFILEGAVWGLTGGALGAGFLWLLDQFVAPRLTAAMAQLTGGVVLRLFAAPLLAGMAVSGLVLGCVGSFMAVQRFLGREAT